MTISAEQREELKRRAPTPEEVDTLLHDSARLERIERQVWKLADTMDAAVQQEADQGRKGHAFMLQHWTGKVRATVDTGRGEGGEG